MICPINKEGISGIAQMNKSSRRSCEMTNWSKILLLLVAFGFVLGSIGGASSENHSRFGTSSWSSSLSTTMQEGLMQEIRQNPHNPVSWRKWGKLQLDNLEYAEAYRIFRKGSDFNPDDPGLRHHVQVHEAFHGPSCFLNNHPLEIPPLEKPKLPEKVFLTLSVPEAPVSIQRWKGKLPPSQRLQLIHASKEPILSRQACQYLIDAALQVAETHGWTKNRHVHAPTCDMPAHTLPPPALSWIRNAFDEVLYPLIQEAFGDQLDLSELRMQDCFIVRYDGEDGPGFTDLMPHEDESLISITIALNDMDEYEGGGLYIAPTQDLLNGPAGTVLFFAGGLVHGGYPVKKGTRWILTAFLYCDANASGKKRGFLLREMEMDDEANNYDALE